jgi:hypothetical protein
MMRPTIAALTVLFTVALHAPAAVVEELSPQDLAKLETGQNLVTSIDKPGAVWPEVRIYRKVKATPEGVADLFLDYENASSYIESLDSAVVENKPDANTKDVRYTVRLPVLMSISYLVRNRYEKTPHGHAVHWNLLDSIFAKSADGSLRVEKHGDDTIICYTNHVEPASRLVASLRGHAVKEASRTVDAIVKEAERRHAAQKK